jgi:hypothetical protein
MKVPRSIEKPTIAGKTNYLTFGKNLLGSSKAMNGLLEAAASDP